jgi:hypothetical protein
VPIRLRLLLLSTEPHKVSIVCNDAIASAGIYDLFQGASLATDTLVLGTCAVPCQAVTVIRVLSSATVGR